MCVFFAAILSALNKTSDASEYKFYLINVETLEIAFSWQKNIITYKQKGYTYKCFNAKSVMIYKQNTLNAMITDILQHTKGKSPTKILDYHIFKDLVKFASGKFYEITCKSDTLQLSVAEL